MDEVRPERPPSESGAEREGRGLGDLALRQGDLVDPVRSRAFSQAEASGQADDDFLPVGLNRPDSVAELCSPSPNCDRMHTTMLTRR